MLKHESLCMIDEAAMVALLLCYEKKMLPSNQMFTPTPLSLAPKAPMSLELTNEAPSVGNYHSISSPFNPLIDVIVELIDAMYVENLNNLQDYYLCHNRFHFLHWAFPLL